MRWQVKAHCLAILSRIPMGRVLYRAGQSMLGSSRPDVDLYLRKFDELRGLIERAGAEIPGAVCVEIGTGWSAVVPMLFMLAGAKRVTTVDTNPWLSRRETLNAVSGLRKHINEVATITCFDVEAVNAMLAEFESHLNNEQTVQAALGRCGIDYVCPGDATRLSLPDGSMDIVFSSNVYEHIGPEVLDAIHRESKRVLRVGGVYAHRIDVGDHYRGGDSRITSANFLQFSAAEWNWYGGSGLAYHNRLRCRDHAQMIADAHLEIVDDQRECDSRALGAINSGELRIDTKFASYSHEDLACRFQRIVAVKRE
jgi:SAM-dependent methyltransferase